MEDSWLLIDVVHQGEVRMACVTPAQPKPERIYSFDTLKVPTFTDVLMMFERESDRPLYGRNAIIAFAGAAIGDSVPVVRTRWNISRSGLSSMLGRPVTIINEVAAQAWATTETMPVATAIRGTGAPDLAPRSRHLFVTVEDGIGTAVIDVDDHRHATVLEAEGGHCDFAPQSELEFKLCRALSPLGDPVTFEQVLLMPHDHPAWRVLADLSDRAREELRANILGRLCANLMFATGAWSGVMLRGKSLPDFHPSARAAFDAGFTGRKSFRRLTTAARCWRVEQKEAVLTGAAALMVQRHRKSGS